MRRLDENTPRTLQDQTSAVENHEDVQTGESNGHGQNDEANENGKAAQSVLIPEIRCRFLVVNKDDPRHLKYPNGGFDRHCTHTEMTARVRYISPTPQYCWECCRLYQEKP